MLRESKHLWFLHEMFERLWDGDRFAEKMEKRDDG
jgi:hypothetical protein